MPTGAPPIRLRSVMAGACGSRGAHRADASACRRRPRCWPPQGSTLAPAKYTLMKICDVCGKTTDRLEPGPPELQRLEVCGECFQDLLRRFAIVEKQLAEMKNTLRLEAIAAWQTARKPAG